METLDFRSWKTIAKTVGTVVSISGAMVTILYKGPLIFFTIVSTIFAFARSASSSIANKLGKLYLFARFNLTSVEFSPMFSLAVGLSISNVPLSRSQIERVMTQIVKLYPNEITVAVVSSVLTSVVATAYGVIVENDLSVWTLKTDMALLTVGIFGPALAKAIHTWGLNMKGPVYVTIFTPLSIAITAAMGVVFLGDALYLGSVIGATIILVGFYAVIWGKTKEEPNDIGASEGLLKLI